MSNSKDLFGTVINNGASLSKCRKYRYELWRIWDVELPKVMFIMMNPSTADGTEDDATIRRCISFAKSWGYGGFYVGNLYAYRATDPKELKKVTDPVGFLNTLYLLRMRNKCALTVFAWGNKQGVPEYIVKRFPNAHYLELAKDGTPKHPLFLKSNLKPQKFDE